MEIRVLGPVEAISARGPLPIERPRWRALLAVLALRAGRPLRAEGLVDALWDTDLPTDAKAVLRTHVARLRRALEPDREPRTPPEVLLTVPGGYMLDLDPEGVDAHRFADLAEEGRRRLDEGDSDAALGALDEALDLWRGEPLGELGDTLFATAERGRLQELRRNAQAARLECLLAAGRDEEVAAEAEVLIRSRPLHEPCWAALAAARYRLGRQAAALEGLAEIRRRLLEELGVDPSPELRGLERAVLNQDPTLEGPWPLHPEREQEPGRGGAPDLPLPSPVTLVRTELPFIGRIEERRRLEGAWKAAAAGEHRVALLAGEPGAGKTRLAAEVAQDAHAAGGLVLGGRCDERLSAPYQPFVEALTPCAERADPRVLREALGLRVGHLGRLVPVPVDAPTPPAADPETDRYRLFDAIVAWLRHLGGRAPLLLLVDDLHWATPPTLLLLRHVTRTPDVPLLLVATYRDTELDPFTRDVLAELAAYPDVEHLRLGGLGPDAVRSAVELLAPEGGAIETGPLARAVHEKTEGNPLFVEELLTHLFSEGPLEDLPGRAPDLPFPDGVRELVERRISLFSGETADVLRTAALVGRAWDVPTIAAATGDEERALAALEEGLGAGLLRERDGTLPTYEFAHELVRQALEEGMPLPRRQQRHLQVADALEEVHGPEQIGAVALHLRRAGSAADVGRTVTASMQAAERARRQTALEEAREHAAAAVALVDQRGDDLARTARIRELLGDTMYATGIDPEAGLEQLEAAREAYEALGDRRGAAKVRSRIGRNLSTFFGHVDIRRARRELEEALEMLEPMGPSAPLAFTLIALASSTGWDLRADVGREAATRALEIARRVGHGTAEVNALAVGGQCALNTGDLDEGQRMMAEAHARAVSLGDPLLSWVAAYTFALTGNLLQDPHTWYGWVSDETAAERYDDAPGLRGALLGILADWRPFRHGLADDETLEEGVSEQTLRRRLVADLEGRWEEAARAFIEPAERYLPVENRNLGVYSLWWASREREQQGRLDEALALARRGREELPRGSATWARLFMESRLAVLEASRDRPRAQEHLDACRRILASGEDYRGLAGQVAVAEGVNATEEAQADRAFARARDAYRRTRNPVYEAEVLWRWGIRTSRAEHFDAASEIHERLGTGPPWRALIRASRAEALEG